MTQIKLIATDLDGTLLNSEKTVAPRDREILEKAASLGVTIVPSTGRLLFAIPQDVMDLSGVRYCILANGASIYDAQEDRYILRSEISVETALEVLDYLEPLPCIVGCYMYDRSWMPREAKDKMEYYVPESFFQYLMDSFKEPEGDLRSFISDQQHTVQKIQMFARDHALIDRMLTDFPERFPGLVVTSAIRNNIEINAADANKGTALRLLSEHLGIKREETLAIGDGLNDMGMIMQAGIGVAMENAISPLVKEAADFVTADCDHAGVGEAVLRFCLKNGSEQN